MTNEKQMKSYLKFLTSIPFQMVSQMITLKLRSIKKQFVVTMTANLRFHSSLLVGVCLFATGHR